MILKFLIKSIWKIMSDKNLIYRSFKDENDQSLESL